MAIEKPVLVDVAWATSAGDFLPFTALPARFHGKTVELVIVKNAQPVAIPETAPAFDLASDDMPWPT